MNYTTLETSLDQGIARIWLNRPEVRNAMNETLIAELTEAIGRAGTNDDVRVIVLAGRGSAFCAGGDLNWMKRGRAFTPEQNRADAAKLAWMLRAIHESPKPTVARLHGSVFAGGMGLAAACDIAVATSDAKFCLSEVRLGLVPAMISPYVLRRMGEAMARRYCLTAEVFDAAEACRIGFVHQLCAPGELDTALDALLGQLRQNGPQALAATKELIRDVCYRPIDDALIADTAARIAAARASEEGQEGIAAFFDKRRPAWARTGD